jgi:hypothetical protein
MIARWRERTGVREDCSIHFTVGQIGAEEGTRTPTPLRVHGPEPCASANSATSASDHNAGRPGTALKEDATASILQGRCEVSNFRSWLLVLGSSSSSWAECKLLNALYQEPRAKSQELDFPMASPKAARSKSKKADEVARLRVLAHDLSNSLEAILQATYLLQQAKLEGDSQRWVNLIDSSSQEAARINGEIREALRALSGE